MNGLMNRLSDQSKDSVVRSVKAIFDSNSLSVVRRGVLRASFNSKMFLQQLTMIPFKRCH